MRLLNVRFPSTERQLSERSTDRSGSIAPIRFLKQRPFDQRFARLGSPNFERLLCRVFHCGCDDEQRLLCFETGHSRASFLRHEWPKVADCRRYLTVFEWPLLFGRPTGRKLSAEGAPGSVHIQSSVMQINADTVCLVRTQFRQFKPPW